MASAFAMASRMDGLVRSRTRKVPSFIRVTDSRRFGRASAKCVAVAIDDRDLHVLVVSFEEEEVGP